MCPHVNEYKTFKATYAKIPILGQTQPGVKLMTLDCDSSEKCGHEFDCPVARRDIW